MRQTLNAGRGRLSRQTTPHDSGSPGSQPFRSTASSTWFAERRVRGKAGRVSHWPVARPLDAQRVVEPRDAVEITGLAQQLTAHSINPRSDWTNAVNTLLARQVDQRSLFVGLREATQAQGRSRGAARICSRSRCYDGLRAKPFTEVKPVRHSPTSISLCQDCWLTDPAVSMMPEELLEALSEAQACDLIACLMGYTQRCRPIGRNDAAGRLVVDSPSP
jgi:hypothetical protein